MIFIKILEMEKGVTIYKIIKIDCNYESCKKKIDVVITSIESIATHKTIDFSTINTQNLLDKENKEVFPIMKFF